MSTGRPLRILVISTNCMLIASPVPLKQNWINECAKFFAPALLRAKEFSRSEWEKDTDPRCVWIIKLSMLSWRSEFYQFMAGSQYSQLRILSTWWDEAHIFARSESSTRLDLLRKFCRSIRIQRHRYRHAIPSWSLRRCPRSFAFSRR